MGAIILDEDRVLLIERAKPPQLGMWSLPGGAVELGERLEDAVRREVLEETGLLVDVLRVVEVFERITKDSHGTVEYHYVLIDYLCRVAGGKLEARDDASRAEWVPRVELSSRKITEGTIPVIEKAFRTQPAP